MNAQGSISVVEPVGRAFDWTLQVLFRPFDPGKWFTIGFCAWLAFFGESGGGGFNFPGGGGHGGHGGRGGDFRAELERVQDFVVSNLYWIIPLVIFVILLAIVFMVLFTWLSSRGKFMFLHCVVQNKAEVSAPWKQYGKFGDSLFRFRLVLALLGLAIILPVLGLVGFGAYRMLMRPSVDAALVMLLVGSILLFIFLAIGFWLLKKIVEDFLVPIMFARGTLWREGWRETVSLISANLGTFILYFLFQIVLGFVTGILMLAVVLCTCCIAGCLMLIPYIGTVVVLPVLVFYRAYSAFFLAQFGPQYDLFAART